MKKANKPFIEPKTDAYLKDIAIQLYDGHIFCNLQIQHMKEIGMVFMPLLFDALKDWKKEEIKNIGLVYEYISKAYPTSINGMPCFGSCAFLSVEETNRMLKFFEQYKSLKELFKETT